MFSLTGDTILASAQDAARRQNLALGADERNPRIGVRYFRGGEQFRAYPHGLEHPDGGSGPWLSSFERAEGVLAQADEEIARQEAARAAYDAAQAEPRPTDGELMAGLLEAVVQGQQVQASTVTRRPPTTTRTSRAIALRIGRYISEYDPTAKMPNTAQFLRLEVRSDGYADAHVEGEHTAHGLCSYPTAQECGERGAAAEFVECGA